MASKNSRAVASDEPANAVLAPLNILADLPRKQMALMTRSATAVLRGSEALRNIQQQAAHRALTHNEEAAERLRGRVDFNELLAIQAEMLRFNMQETAQFWQQLTTAALKVQADMVSSAGEALETGEPTLDSLQRAFAASLNGETAATATH